MQETWVQFLGREDPLEREMATHSSIPDWEIHGQRSLAGYSLWGCKELDTAEHTHSTLQYSSSLLTIYFIHSSVYMLIPNS